MALFKSFTAEGKLQRERDRAFKEINRERMIREQLESKQARLASKKEQTQLKEELRKLRKEEKLRNAEIRRNRVLKLKSVGGKVIRFSKRNNKYLPNYDSLRKKVLKR